MVILDDVRKIATELDRKSDQEKLAFYEPFGPDRLHFTDPDNHECDFSHTADLTDIRPDELKRHLGFHPDEDLFVADSQLDFHQSRSDSRWLFSSNKAGKTLAGASESSLYLLGPEGEQFWDGFPDEVKDFYNSINTPIEGWVVSATGDAQEEGPQRWLLKEGILPSEFIENKWKKSKDQYDKVKLTNGSELKFKSCDSDSDSFEGAGKRFIWFDEEPDQEIYEECIMREEGFTDLDIWGTMTRVDGVQFVQNQIIEQPEEHDIFYWTLWDNPHYPNEKVQEKENKLPEDQVNLRIYGMVDQSERLIYPMFSEEIHVRETFEIPAEWTIYEGVDPGLKNPAGVVWWAVSPHGYHYIIDELYETGLNIAGICRKIMEVRKNPTFYEKGQYDPIATIGDPQIRQENQQTRMTAERRFRSDRYGPRINIRPGSKDSAGIETIRDLMNPSMGVERETRSGSEFYILSHCEKTIYETKRYKTRELRGKAETRRNPYEKPQKKDDHLMNAEKYIANENPQYIDNVGTARSYQRRKQRMTGGSQDYQDAVDKKKKKVRQHA